MTHSQSPSKPNQGPNALADKVTELRDVLSRLDPRRVAQNSAAELNADVLRLSLFGQDVILRYPNLVAENDQGASLPISTQAMLLYYLTTADGSPQAGRWVSFAELQDGRVYAAAYQGYTGDHLLKTAGERYAALRAACLALGGQPGEIGHLSFSFSALPRVPLFLSIWLGDEDFPSSAKILFDACARHYLPIDACAILGSMLTSRILKAMPMSEPEDVRQAGQP